MNGRLQEKASGKYIVILRKTENVMRSGFPCGASFSCNKNKQAEKPDH